MENTADASKEIRLVMMVNKYATPLAVILTGLALAFSNPVGTIRAVSVSLLVFGVLFNLAAVPLIRRTGANAAWLPRVRMLINITVNVVLVYCLGGHWPTIWMLLALTPIATAIYDDKKKTALTAIAVSLVLIILQAMRGHNTPALWAEVAGRSAFIVLVSLLVNELSLLSREKS